MSENKTGPLAAFKGFTKDLTCRGFKYELDQTYEQAEPARLCSSGFHAVTWPLDAFSYYPPGESVYHEVQLEGVDPKRQGDSKVAGRKITVGAAVSIPGIVKAHIELVLSQTLKKGSKHVEDDRSASSATGYRSASSATGDRSASSATGYRSASSATGYQSASSATGDRSASSATGYQSASSATGDRSASSATGYRSASSATGYRSASSATGDRSASLNTGNFGTSRVSRSDGDGPEAVAIATGYKGSAAGSEGDWLVLTERDDNARIVGMKTVRVDGKRVKADVFYELIDGKVTEVK